MVSKLAKDLLRHGKFNDAPGAGIVPTTATLTKMATGQDPT
jgi:hypothetical protein